MPHLGDSPALFAPTSGRCCIIGGGGGVFLVVVDAGFALLFGVDVGPVRKVKLPGLEKSL